MIDEELNAVQGLGFGSHVKEEERLKMNSNRNWQPAMRHEQRCDKREFMEIKNRQSSIIWVALERSMEDASGPVWS